MNIFYAINACAALFGFCLATSIAHTKRAKKPLVCPLNGSCDDVVHSSHSRFMGIPLEYFGILYYGFATISYGILTVFPVPPSQEFLFITYVMTGFAFLFSLYLTFVQAFTLKKWCTWCLVSAGISTLLFFFVAYTTSFDRRAFIDMHTIALALISSIGLVLGVGGTTIGDILFFSFLRDLKISKDEATILKTVNEVVWVGLALSLVTSVILYSTHPLLLWYRPSHSASMLLLLIIFANALFLHLLVEPALVHISFGGKHEHATGELRFLRQFSFVLLTVSLVSWYTLFVVQFMSAQLSSMSGIIGSYTLALVVALVLSQRIEQRLASGKFLLE